MNIASLQAFEVPIALRKPIRHASHVRHGNDTLIVRCELNTGHVGWGEGLPREYVTGESIDTVWQHLQATDFRQLTDLEFGSATDAADAIAALRLGTVKRLSSSVGRDCFGNSVLCAIELAVLDAASQEAGSSIGELLRSKADAAGIAANHQTVRYSGVVTTARSALQQYRSAVRMKLFGFHQLKVKVGSDDVDDAQLLRRVRRVVRPSVDVRLDVNEAWDVEDVVRKMNQLESFGISSLEQPVSHHDVAHLAGIRTELKVSVMLDESLCSLQDAQNAIEGGWCDAFNLRISKCGGLMRTLEIAALAKQHNITCQLGCLVGETGILSAAGRHFACSVSGLNYLEGSYDRFLVKDPLTEQDRTFGYGGKAKALLAPGLGITINEARVRQLAKRTLELH